MAESPEGLDATALELTQRLIAVDSVNPGLVPGAAGEGAIAEFLAQRLRRSGLEVHLVALERRPDRPSVVAIHTGGGGRTVVLNGHLDTVGVEGMTDPFAPRLEGGRLFGRGSSDMKGGLAGLVVAAETLRRRRVPGRVVLALVADEEDASLGSEAVIRELGTHGIRGDVCLIAEPTWLDFAVAHRGYAVVRVQLRGRAAHSSQPDQGVNATSHLGRLLVAVDAAGSRLGDGVAHPLVGRGSLMATVARAGGAPFTLAAGAEALIERRTIPGEPGKRALDEVRSIVAELRKDDPEVDGTCELVIARDPWELADDSAAGELLGFLSTSLRTTGAPQPRRVGAPYWMESALWEESGVPTVLYGPAGGGLHAADEWVDVAQVRAFPEAVAAAVERFLRTVPGAPRESARR
jgi:acetylornithine deacetylase